MKAKHDNAAMPHIVAFLTVAVWGTTFVSTKLLIQNGLSPEQIFLLRFAIAYALMLGYYVAGSREQGAGNRWMCGSWRDEALMLALGLTGGSLYFLTENMALLYTTATNTSLIVCSCPLFAALLIRLFYPKGYPLGRQQIAGSLIACVGMAIVVLNGRFVLHLSPRGDALAFAACLCWAAYSLVMIPVSKRYGSLFITRKVFAYGLLTILPLFFFDNRLPDIYTLTRPEVIGNLLFLGCVASLLCYLAWAWCISKLGAVRATNWVYVNPLTTIIAASIILNERITIYFLIGAAMIIAGLYLSEKQKNTSTQDNNLSTSTQMVN